MYVLAKFIGTGFFFDNSEESEENVDESTGVTYYSSEAQLEELLQTLDREKWETDLVKNIEEIKEEILRQMAITEQLTNDAKNGRRSILENEHGMSDLEVHIVIFTSSS